MTDDAATDETIVVAPCVHATTAWDDDGAGAAETTVVPAQTEAAAQLAWSRDDADVSDERPHRPWRVALLSAVAVLAVSGCITLVIAIWPRHHAESSSQAGAMESTTTPAASLPPTSTASDAPNSLNPRPLEYDSRGVPLLPRDATPEERRQVLLAKLDHADIPYSSPAAVAIDAESVCEHLASGHYTFAELMTWIRETHPSLTGDQPGGFVGASIGTYCRQYGYLVDPDNASATS